MMRPARPLLWAALLLALALAATGHANAFTVEEAPALRQHLDERGIRGVIALYDPQTDIVSVSDVKRARTSYLPASTFKLPAALLALETGVVKDPYRDRLPWDGKAFFVKACNADQTLATALARSCLPFFARLGRQIGDKRLAAGLKSIDYGDARATGAYPYWTEGDLRISPLQQISFLDRLRRRDLPVSPSAMTDVTEMIVLERDGDYVLRGKTGWASKPKPQIGWFVGWAEKAGKIRVFAINIDMRGAKDISVRLEIAKAALAAQGLAP